MSWRGELARDTVSWLADGQCVSNEGSLSAAEVADVLEEMLYRRIEALMICCWDMRGVECEASKGTVREAGM